MDANTKSAITLNFRSGKDRWKTSKERWKTIRTQLSEDERAEFDQFDYLLNRPPASQFKKTIITCIVGGCLTAIAIICASVVASTNGGASARPWVDSVFVCLSGTMFVALIIMVIEEIALMGAKRQWDSFSSLAAERPQGRPLSSDDSMTLRQSQHLWYGGHRELNWQDRVMGETLGFDNADSYVNNFLEHDKD